MLPHEESKSVISPCYSLYMFFSLCSLPFHHNASYYALCIRIYTCNIYMLVIMRPLTTWDVYTRTCVRLFLLDSTHGMRNRAFVCALLSASVIICIRVPTCEDAFVQLKNIAYPLTPAYDSARSHSCVRIRTCVCALCAFRYIRVLRRCTYGYRRLSMCTSVCV